MEENTFKASRSGKRGKHGMCTAPEFWAWVAMIQRCHAENHPNFKHYGARGITVCQEWRDSFAAFFAHVGARPSAQYSIDRFPDNNGNYEPGNVRWAKRGEQMRNTRANHWIEIDGVRKLITDWAAERDLHQTTISHRLARGMSERDAVMTPARFGGRRASKIACT